MVVKPRLQSAIEAVMLAWHYTTGEKFKLIVESGALLPTANHIARGDKRFSGFPLSNFGSRRQKRRCCGTANKSALE
jgi:hypothetical protein